MSDTKATEPVVGSVGEEMQSSLSQVTTAEFLEDKSVLRSKVVNEVKGFANALLIALFIRTFLYQPFMIPSESMYPTLEVGDFLLVNKFTYGYGNKSFPIPFDHNFAVNRILPGELKRGDVVVFHNAKHRDANNKLEPLDYIKRLVGLPGDRLQMIQGVLHINGEPVKLEQIADYQMVDTKGRFQVSSQYIETLPNGVKHPILKSMPQGQGWLDNTEEFVVPEGHYFMMGDNRDNSKDSRVLSAVGYIPYKEIIGRADVVVMCHLGEKWKPWTWLNIRFDRGLHIIR